METRDPTTSDGRPIEIRDGLGYAGGELYQGFVDGEYAGEMWVNGGRVKLLDVRGPFRRRGIASALMDHVRSVEGEELVYELDLCELDGYIFLDSYERSRAVEVRRGEVLS